MQRLSTFSLILMSLIWILHAHVLRTTNETAAVSNAMALEANLMKWASQHTSTEARREIFKDSYTLTLGGEQDDRDFRQMIRDIVAQSSLPKWPGWIGLTIGITGLVLSRIGKGQLPEDAPATSTSTP